MAEETGIIKFKDVDISDSKIIEEEIIEQPKPTEDKKSEKSEDKTTMSDKKSPDKTDEKDADKLEKPEPDKEEPKVQKFTIDNDEYTEEEVKQSIKDASNMHAMRKSSQEKYDEAAKIRKGIEPLVQLRQKLDEMKNDEDIGDAISILQEKFGKEVVDAVLNLDIADVPNPFQKEVEEKDEIIAQLETENTIRDEIEQLKKDEEIGDKKINALFEFLDKQHKEHNIDYPNLKEGYKAMNYDELKKSEQELKEELKEKLKEKEEDVPSKVPSKTKGATEIKKQDKLPGSFKEISWAGYDIHGPD